MENKDIKGLTIVVFGEILILMSSELKIFATTIVGALIGILEATGHLNAASGSQFQTDLTAIGGTAIALISIIVLFYHQLLILESDLKNIDWEGPTENEQKITTTTTTTTPPTP